VTIVTFDPFEVIGNSFADLGCIAFSKMLCNPFKWVVVALAAVARLTCADDIVRRVTAILIHWDKMVLMQNSWIVPQFRRMTAIGTRSIKVFKRNVPIGLSESTRKFFLFTSSILSRPTNVFWVILSPFSFSFVLLIQMAISVSLYLSPGFIGIIFSPAMLSLSGGIWMLFTVNLTVSVHFIFIVLLPFFNSGTITYLTQCTVSVLIATFVSEFCYWKRWAIWMQTIFSETAGSCIHLRILKQSRLRWLPRLLRFVQMTHVNLFKFIAGQSDTFEPSGTVSSAVMMFKLTVANDNLDILSRI